VSVSYRVSGQQQALQKRLPEYSILEVTRPSVRSKSCETLYLWGCGDVSALPSLNESTFSNARSMVLFILQCAQGLLEHWGRHRAHWSSLSHRKLIRQSRAKQIAWRAGDMPIL
jgi:hypothetical protein